MTTKSSSSPGAGTSSPTVRAFSPEEIRHIAERRGYFGSTPKPLDKRGDEVASFKGARVLEIDVTPVLAALWLKNNFGNRPVKEDVVVAYARDMLNGSWVQTHQGIAFNEDDRLIDGQHRLRAILMSAVTIRMLVTFGLPSRIEGKEMTTMDCVDRGRTRSVADQLTIQHGFKYGSLTASICAALATLCCRERTRRLSVGQTLEVYRAFEKSCQFVIENRSRSHGLKSAGVLAAFAFAHALLGKPVEEMFFHLNSPDQFTKFPMVGLLKGFLTSDEAKLISRSLDRGLAEMTLQVLWLEKQGKRVAKLELALDGADWFRAQQPDRAANIAALFKLPAVESIAKTKAVAPLSQVQPVEPAAPVTPDRPSLDRIMSAVESKTKLSRFIITGRGDDNEIHSARVIFVCIARRYGHTEQAVGAFVKKPLQVVRDLEVPASAMTTKQRLTIEKLREGFNKK